MCFEQREGQYIGFASQQVVIQLSPDALQTLGSPVFYVDRGRLEAERLDCLSSPLEKGALLCGLASKTELNWFKFKTVLRDRMAAARQRALFLRARFG